MPELSLQPIPVVENISKAEFKTQFLAPNKPVVMKSFANWAATKKWDYDYFKKHCGDVMVPLYAESFADTENNYMATNDRMRFADYLDLIASQPTNKRMFLFNIFKHMPQLCDDFDYPDIIDHYAKSHPFMFFGGEGSHVDIHQDLDLSHVFLTQFTGTKEVILFKPEYSTHLYRHPLTVSTNVDFRAPDFERYPLLANLQGYHYKLQRGETLFIPSGYWHYIYYTTGGFSLSLRARPESQLRRIRGYGKILNLLVVDRLVARLIGAKKWYDIKEQMAVKRAEKLLAE